MIYDNEITKHHLVAKPSQAPLCPTVWTFEKSMPEKSGQVDWDVIIIIGRFSVLTPLGFRPGLGSQPRLEAPVDFLVEIVKTQ